MQDDYDAWLEGFFSHQNEENFANSRLVRCQDCHMPLVEASDPSANTRGEVRSHHFPRANTFPPLLRNGTAQLEETIRFMQSNKLRVSNNGVGHNFLGERRTLTNRGLSFWRQISRAAASTIAVRLARH